MASHTTTAGGHGRARRQSCALVVIILAVASLAQARAAGDESRSEVVVHEARGVYTVAARFTVPHAQEIAHAVLTDYEQIPRFMPDVKTSVVRERSEGRAVVEQQAVSRVMMFSKRVHLLLEVSERRDAVRFRDASGQSFTEYEGAWLLSEHDGETTISYQLRANPSFAVPEFLLRQLFRKDATRMIGRLRTEIAARSHVTSTLAPR